MNQQALYEKILGLSSPWHVVDIDLDESNGEIHVHVDCNANVGLF